MNILAAEYLRIAEAADCLADFVRLRGMVLGVSKSQQAMETFPILGNTLHKSANLPEVTVS
jgi:hypothetical protein